MTMSAAAARCGRNVIAMVAAIARGRQPRAVP